MVKIKGNAPQTWHQMLKREINCKVSCHLELGDIFVFKVPSNPKTGGFKQYKCLHLKKLSCKIVNIDCRNKMNSMKSERFNGVYWKFC